MTAVCTLTVRDLMITAACSAIARDLMVTLFNLFTETEGEAGQSYWTEKSVVSLFHVYVSASTREQAS